MLQSVGLQRVGQDLVTEQQQQQQQLFLCLKLIQNMEFKERDRSRFCGP